MNTHNITSMIDQLVNNAIAEQSAQIDKAIMEMFVSACEKYGLVVPPLHELKEFAQMHSLTNVQEAETHNLFFKPNPSDSKFTYLFSWKTQILPSEPLHPSSAQRMSIGAQLVFFDLGLEPQELPYE